MLDAKRLPHSRDRLQHRRGPAYNRGRTSLSRHGVPQPVAAQRAERGLSCPADWFSEAAFAFKVRAIVRSQTFASSSKTRCFSFLARAALLRKSAALSRSSVMRSFTKRAYCVLRGGDSLPRRS
jgi:hypothetical protein